VASAEPICIHPENNKLFLFRGRPRVLLCATEHYGSVREGSNVHLKSRIGQAAAELIQDGQSVVLDASTTALQIARAAPEAASARCKHG